MGQNSIPIDKHFGTDGDEGLVSGVKGYFNSSSLSGEGNSYGVFASDAGYTWKPTTFHSGGKISGSGEGLTKAHDGEGSYLSRGWLRLRA